MPPVVFTVPKPPPPPPAVLKPLVPKVTAPEANYTSNAIIAPKSNKLQVLATCQVSGSNALTGRANWPAQVRVCADAASCKQTDYDPAGPFLTPHSVHYNGANYTASYNFTLFPAALSDEGATQRNFFCLYNNTKTLSKLSVASLVVRPLVPQKPPPVLKPLAPTITAPEANYASGAIMAPKTNRLQVVAACKVAGSNALTQPANWPAQLRVCSSTASCSKMDFDRSGPFLTPQSVHYDGANYTASYHFTLAPASLSDQAATLRNFFCLYNNTRALSKLSVTSLVVRPFRPPARSPSPPPPRPRPNPMPPPPPASAAIVGDPHYRGFDYSGGAWNTLIGQPGQHLLYSDGAGVQLSATIAGGGVDSKSLFIQAVQLTRGGLATTTSLTKVGSAWQTSVMAMGKKVPSAPPAVLGGDITVRALVKGGRTAGVFITLPYLSIRCEQMAPSKPQQLTAAFPNWFDCYLTVLKALPPPTGGLLGSTYRPPPMAAAATSAAAAQRPAPTAALVFEEAS